MRFKGSGMLAWLLLALCSQPLLLGRQTEQPSAPGLVIKRTVRRVILDVVVTGTDGKPARGLESKDFSVTEDKVPQQILSFDPHGFDAAMDYTPLKLPPLPVNTYFDMPATPERGPLNVVLFDQLDTALEDQGIAREQLLKFIREKPEGSRFAVFGLSDDLHLIQGFTSDKEKLLEAVSKRKGAPHMPSVFLFADNYGGGSIYTMVRAFSEIASFLDGMPGRKNLLWMAGSFPLTLVTDDNSAVNNGDVNDEIRKAIDLLARHQIALYPVDVRGLVVSFSPAQIGFLDRQYIAEREIADDTGGHAFQSDNDVKGALASATENGAAYYTLSYSPTNRTYDGKTRHMHVTLSTPGYTLEYRRAYIAEDPDLPPGGKTRSPAIEQAAEQPADPLVLTMKHGAPSNHDLMFQAHLEAQGAPAMATPEQMTHITEHLNYFESRRKKSKPQPPVKLQTYAIEYAVPSRQFAIGVAQPLHVEFAAAAYDADGFMLAGRVQPAQEDAPGPQPPKIYRVHQQMEVPWNAAWIRLAVRDLSTGRMGTLEVALPLAPELPAQAAVPGAVSGTRRE